LQTTYQQKETTAILVDMVLTKNGTIQALRPVYDSKNAIPYTEPEKTDWLKRYANTHRIQDMLDNNVNNPQLPFGNLNNIK
jgi:hypothetical protein